MRSNPESSIKVIVSRLGSEEIEVSLPVDSTVREALEKAGVPVSDRTEIFVSGVRAEMDNLLDDGDVLALTTPKQAGSR